MSLHKICFTQSEAWALPGSQWHYLYHDDIPISALVGNKPGMRDTSFSSDTVVSPPGLTLDMVLALWDWACGAWAPSINNFHCLGKRQLGKHGSMGGQ